MVKTYDARRQRWDDDARSEVAAAARLRRLQRMSMLSAAGVLLVYSLGFAAWRGIQKHNAEAAAAEAAASASASAKAEASRSARAQASADAKVRADAIADPSDSEVAAAPPAGYQRYQDAEGWTIDVPQGWSRKVEERVGHASIVTYQEHNGTRRLQVFSVEDTSPYESVRLADEYLGGGGAKEYHRVDLTELPVFNAYDTPSARLEYTFVDNASGDTRRTVDVRFEAANDQYYAVAATGAAGEESRQNKVVKTALASFCPADTECTPV
jgi:hypothetical protein